MNTFSKKKKRARLKSERVRRQVHKLGPTYDKEWVNDPASLVEAQLIHESTCGIWRNHVCSCRPRIEWVRVEGEPVEVAP